MSGYLSNLLTKTTTRYTTLRRTLLSSEDDGDTEDDSHITRVLRAYYVENSRSLPSWLPDDPRRPTVPQPQSSYQSIWTKDAPSQGVQPSSNYQNTGRGGGGLSDLWDNNGPRGTSPAPGSLRRVPGARPAPVQQQQQQESLQVRPLPSQRAGSYQSQRPQAVAADPVPAVSAGGGTAQERLKARLYGSGRAGSPSFNSSNSSASGGGGRWG